MISLTVVRILGNFWQYVLGLTDYEIEWKITTVQELRKRLKLADNVIVYGYSNDDFYHKKAIIEINQDLDNKQAEQTIIHELLHLILNRTGNIFDITCSDVLGGRLLKQIYSDWTEISINQIAKAFLTYKRLLKDMLKKGGRNGKKKQEISKARSA